MRRLLLALALVALLAPAVVALSPAKQAEAAGYQYWEHPVFGFVSTTYDQGTANANCQAISRYYAMRGSVWQRDLRTGTWINYYNAWWIWGNVSTQTCIWNQ